MYNQQNGTLSVPSESHILKIMLKLSVPSESHILKIILIFTLTSRRRRGAAEPRQKNCGADDKITIRKYDTRTELPMSASQSVGFVF